MNAKLRDIYGLDGPHLVRSLRDYGLEPGDIDIVMDTHLHFDHCGGNTQHRKRQGCASVPNAHYIVHKNEFEHAMHPTERDRASYFPDNFAPVEAGQLPLGGDESKSLPASK